MCSSVAQPSSRAHKYKQVAKLAGKVIRKGYGIVTRSRGRPPKSATSNYEYKGNKLPPRNNSKYHRTEEIVTAPASGLSHSYSKMIYKKKPLIRNQDKIHEPTIYETINSGQYLGFGGRQAVNTGSVNFLYAPAPNAFSVNLKSICNVALQYLNTTGTYVGNPAIQANQQSMKFILDSNNTISEFTNQSLGSCELEIYDLVSRVSTAVYIDPTVIWQQGLVNEDVSIISPIQTTIFNTPTSSKAFNLTWKIVKRTKIELGPGRSHEHVWNFKPNVLIDSEHFNIFNQVKGLTTAQMIVQRGLLGDTVVGYMTGAVTTTESKLDFVVRNKTIIRPMQVFPRHYYQVNNLSAGLGNLNIVQEGSGLVVNPQGTEA
jgi:hypothetical protein